MDENRKKLYDQLSAQWDMGTFDEFDSDLDNEDNQKVAWQAVGGQDGYGDFGLFQQAIQRSPQAAETRQAEPDATQPIATQPDAAPMMDAQQPALATADASGQGAALTQQTGTDVQPATDTAKAIDDRTATEIQHPTTPKDEPAEDEEIVNEPDAENTVSAPVAEETVETDVVEPVRVDAVDYSTLSDDELMRNMGVLPGHELTQRDIDGRMTYIASIADPLVQQSEYEKLDKSIGEWNRRIERSTVAAREAAMATSKKEESKVAAQLNENSKYISDEINATLKKDTDVDMSGTSEFTRAMMNDGLFKQFNDIIREIRSNIASWSDERLRQELTNRTFDNEADSMERAVWIVAIAKELEARSRGGHATTVGEDNFAEYIESLRAQDPERARAIEAHADGYDTATRGHTSSVQNHGDAALDDNPSYAVPRIAFELLKQRRAELSRRMDALKQGAPGGTTIAAIEAMGYGEMLTAEDYDACFRQAEELFGRDKIQGYNAQIMRRHDETMGEAVARYEREVMSTFMDIVSDDMRPKNNWEYVFGYIAHNNFGSRVLQGLHGALYGAPKGLDFSTVYNSSVAQYTTSNSDGVLNVAAQVFAPTATFMLGAGCIGEYVAPNIVGRWTSNFALRAVGGGTAAGMRSMAQKGIVKYGTSMLSTGTNFAALGLQNELIHQLSTGDVGGVRLLVATLEEGLKGAAFGGATALMGKVFERATGWKAYVGEAAKIGVEASAFTGMGYLEARMNGKDGLTLADVGTNIGIVAGSKMSHFKQWSSEVRQRARNEGIYGRKVNYHEISEREREQLESLGYHGVAIALKGSRLSEDQARAIDAELSQMRNDKNVPWELVRCADWVLNGRTSVPPAVADARVDGDAVNGYVITAVDSTGRAIRGGVTVKGNDAKNAMVRLIKKEADVARYAAREQQMVEAQSARDQAMCAQQFCAMSDGKYTDVGVVLKVFGEALRKVDAKEKLGDVEEEVLTGVGVLLAKMDMSDIVGDRRKQTEQAYKVDLDKAIKKDASERTDAEKAAVKDYDAWLDTNKDLLNLESEQFAEWLRGGGTDGTSPWSSASGDTSAEARGWLTSWSDKIDTSDLVIVESIDQVADATVREEIKASEREGRKDVPGWSIGGKAYVYLPHIGDKADFDKTVMHELVAHRGLRGLLGENRFNDLCDRVWNSMSAADRARLWNYPSSELAKNERDRQRAVADEYIAQLSERTDAEGLHLWNKFVALLYEHLHVNIMGTGLDAQLREDIRESYRNLREQRGEQAERGGEGEPEHIHEDKPDDGAVPPDDGGTPPPEGVAAPPAADGGETPAAGGEPPVERPTAAVGRVEGTPADIEDWRKLMTLDPDELDSSQVTEGLSLLEAEREQAHRYANGELAEEPSNWEHWAARDGLSVPENPGANAGGATGVAPVAGGGRALARPKARPTEPKRKGSLPKVKQNEPRRSEQPEQVERPEHSDKPLNELTAEELDGEITRLMEYFDGGGQDADGSLDRRLSELYAEQSRREAEVKEPSAEEVIAPTETVETPADSDGTGTVDTGGDELPVRSAAAQTDGTAADTHDIRELYPNDYGEITGESLDMYLEAAEQSRKQAHDYANGEAERPDENVWRYWASRDGLTDPAERQAEPVATEPIVAETPVEVLRGEFSEQIGKSKHGVELDETSIDDGEMELTGRIKVDGEDSNVVLVHGEGDTPDSNWNYASVTLPGKDYEELGRLAGEFNRIKGRDVAREDSDALRLNFTDIDDAIEFDRWARAREQEPAGGIEQPAGNRDKPRITKDTDPYGVEHYGYDDSAYDKAFELEKEHAAELDKLEGLNDEEYESAADEIMRKLPYGFDVFYDKETGVSHIEPAEPTRYGVGNLHETNRKFKIGEHIQLNFHGRYPHAIVTRINENGKVVEAIDAEDGRVVIRDGKFLSTDEVLAQKKLPKGANADATTIDPKDLPESGHIANMADAWGEVTRVEIVGQNADGTTRVKVWFKNRPNQRGIDVNVDMGGTPQPPEPPTTPPSEPTGSTDDQRMNQTLDETLGSQPEVDKAAADYMPMENKGGGRMSPNWEKATAEQVVNYVLREDVTDSPRTMMEERVRVAQERVEKIRKERPFKGDARTAQQERKLSTWQNRLDKAEQQLGKMRQAESALREELIARQRARGEEEIRNRQTIAQLTDTVSGHVDEMDLADYVAYQIGTGKSKLKWKDQEKGTGRTHGLGGHLGLSGSSAERKARRAFIDDKNGMWPEEYAELLYANMPEGLRARYSDRDVLNAVLDVMRGASSRVGIMQDLASRWGSGETLEQRIERERDEWDRQQEEDMREQQEVDEQMRRNDVAATEGAEAVVDADYADLIADAQARLNDPNASEFEKQAARAVLRFRQRDGRGGASAQGTEGGGVRFRYRDEERRPTFYSNAERAVENVKQGKATAEQWKAMLTKAGGIKAGEDKWMGLTEWLDEHKGQSLTKDEVLQFVRDNGIEMEEVNYGGDVYSNPRMQELQAEYRTIYDNLKAQRSAAYDEAAAFNNKMVEKYGTEAWHSLLDEGDKAQHQQMVDDFERKFGAGLDDAAMREMTHRYGDDFASGFDGVIGNLRVDYGFDGIPVDEAKHYLGDINPIESTRELYTTRGLENKREIAFVVDDIEPYQQYDEIHFGPENAGKAVMWVRFGETTDTDGNRVLVIDEVQSNRHQDARERGYKGNVDKQKEATLKEHLLEIQKEMDEINDKMKNTNLAKNRNEILQRLEEIDANVPDVSQRGMPRGNMWLKDNRPELWREKGELKAEERRLMTVVDNELRELQKQLDLLEEEKWKVKDELSQSNAVPDAPFEKNWMEVAMKRMLRLAAEEGFDKVAWTTGKQQAERYDLGDVVKSIKATDGFPSGFKEIDIELNNDTGSTSSIRVAKNNGEIVRTGSTFTSDWKGKNLRDVVGKEMAERLLTDGQVNIRGEALRIGGDGMKGFYDEMLPRFMRKYVKKWGSQVGEVELATPGGEVMHSVDVTDPMRDSVLEGQPLFRVRRAPNGKESRLDERQYEQVRTSNFKKWFGDWENNPEEASKIVDANGEPLVVYHQTNRKQYINRETGQNWDDLDWREREEWDRRSDEEWNYAWEEQDFYTFDNRYARQSVEYPGFFFSPRYDEYHEYGDRTIAAYLDMKNPAIDPDIPNAGVTDTAGRDAMESLMRQGYDGVIRTEDGVPSEYIVFRPEQIKSATENNGDFSRENSDIRFRVRDGHEAAVEDARRRLESADASEFERQAARAVIKAYGGGSGDAPDTPGGGVRFRTRDDADMLVDMVKHNNEVERQRRDAVTDFVKAVTDVDELTDSKFATALGKVMRGQRAYDQATVADITTMVKAMMDTGLLTELDNFAVKQILTKVKDSTGKNDITAEANKLIDIMLKHQLRRGKRAFEQQLKVKGMRQDSRGVVVQGGLDYHGQRAAKALKEGLSLGDLQAVSDRIDEAEQRLSDPDEVVRGNAADELDGLYIARQYYDEIKQSEIDEANIKSQLEQAQADHKNGTLSDESYKQLRQASNDALRELRCERVDAWARLNEQLSDRQSESAERAKQFREQQKQRQAEIQHWANSDMEGHSADPHEQETRKKSAGDKARDVAQVVLQPLGTFDKLMRYFGNSHPKGEGYLFGFVRRFMNVRDQWFKERKADFDQMDDAARRIGKAHDRDIKDWSGLYQLIKKLPNLTVSVRGKDYKITQGNATYLLAMEDQTDGRMKLRSMGLTEADMDALRLQVDPMLLELSDWVVHGLLPGMRPRLNQTHIRMFGADMTDIPNYFPIRTSELARNETVNLAQQNGKIRPATITGSIVERKRNNLDLDLGADFFQVTAEHIDEMNHWNSFAEFARDLNTLLSYKRFKAQVHNLNSWRYGNGSDIWQTLESTAAITTGDYLPKTSKADAIINGGIKGLAAANITFRLYTGLKQLLSAPVYLVQARWDDIGYAMANLKGTWQWAIKNLPTFAERWQGRMAGDPILTQGEQERGSQNKKLRTASKWGFAFNAAVDATTVAIGARAIYRTKYRRYKDMGYSDEQANQKALEDAAISVNETQQSGLGAFTSVIQQDRTFWSRMVTLYRNASMGYQRQLAEGLKAMRNGLSAEWRTTAREKVQKKLERDGIDSAMATKVADRLVNREAMRGFALAAMFGSIAPFVWSLGAQYLGYKMAGGDDDDQENKMLGQASTHLASGWLEGIVGGATISSLADFAYDYYHGRKKLRDFSLQHDLLSDMAEQIVGKSSGKPADAVYDIVNMIVAMSTGVNPKSIVEPTVGIIDVVGNWGGDAELAHEVALGWCRVLNVPQTSLDQVYVDEIGLSAKEARQLTAEQFAERWCRYKRRRTAGYMSPLTSAESDKEQEGKLLKRYERMMDERFESLSDERVEQIMRESDDELLKKHATKAYKSRIDALSDDDVQAAIVPLSDNAPQDSVDVKREGIKRAYKSEGLSYDTPSDRERNVLAYERHATYDDIAEDTALKGRRDALKKSVGETFEKMGVKYKKGSAGWDWYAEDDASASIGEIKAYYQAHKAELDEYGILLWWFDDSKGSSGYIKKGFTDGKHDPDEVMKEYREARKEVLARTKQR